MRGAQWSLSWMAGPVPGAAGGGGLPPSSCVCQGSQPCLVQPRGHVSSPGEDRPAGEAVSRSVRSHRGTLGADLWAGTCQVAQGAGQRETRVSVAVSIVPIFPAASWGRPFRSYPSLLFRFGGSGHCPLRRDLPSPPEGAEDTGSFLRQKWIKRPGS